MVLKPEAGLAGDRFGGWDGWAPGPRGGGGRVEGSGRRAAGGLDVTTRGLSAAAVCKGTDEGVRGVGRRAGRARRGSAWAGAHGRGS